MNAKYIFLAVLVIALTALLLIGGWFYWFEYRPISIRAACTDLADEAARQLLISKNVAAGGMLDELAGQGMYLKEDYQDLYVDCLRKNGVKE